MKGKKRHRRAKGKKKKQKSSLLITHEEGEGGASSLSHLQERNIPLVPNFPSSSSIMLPVPCNFRH